MEALKIFIFIHRFETINFVSLYFILFVLASVLLYYLFKKNSLILLALSLIFYLCFSVAMTKFVLMLALINYIGGFFLNLRKSKIILFLIILFDLISLGYYKYANFFIDSFHSIGILNNFNTLTYVVVPLGISFFTFEAIHYVVDIYKGKRAIKNPILFLNFIFFFPTLFAGPIKRFEQFMPQVGNSNNDYPLIESGIKLLIRGLFKKIVIANTLANVANFGFDASNNSTIMLIGIYAFSFQIFFDFSGYTDIARGISAMLGIKIPENFLSPYMSANIREFWRRWHITLMQWIRDYIYIPIGGSRKGKIRNFLNTMIVFLISGLWHGSAWHFVIWGGYHGLLMNFNKMFSNKIKITSHILITKLIGIFITFNLVTFGWLLFRGKSMTIILHILKNLLNPNNYFFVTNSFVEKLLFITVLVFVYFLIPHIIKFVNLSEKNKSYLKNLVYSIGIIIIFLSMPTEAVPFVYFQF